MEKLISYRGIKMIVVLIGIKSVCSFVNPPGIRQSMERFPVEYQRNSTGIYVLYKTLVCTCLYRFMRDYSLS